MSVAEAGSLADAAAGVAAALAARVKVDPALAGVPVAASAHGLPVAAAFDLLAAACGASWGPLREHRDYRLRPLPALGVRERWAMLQAERGRGEWGRAVWAAMTEWERDAAAVRLWIANASPAVQALAQLRLRVPAANMVLMSARAAVQEQVDAAIAVSADGTVAGCVWCRGPGSASGRATPLKTRMEDPDLSGLWSITGTNDRMGHADEAYLSEQYDARRLQIGRRAPPLRPRGAWRVRQPWPPLPSRPPPAAPGVSPARR